MGDPQFHWKPLGKQWNGMPTCDDRDLSISLKTLRKTMKWWQPGRHVNMEVRYSISLKTLRETVKWEYLVPLSVSMARWEWTHDDVSFIPPPYQIWYMKSNIKSNSFHVSYMKSSNHEIIWWFDMKFDMKSSKLHHQIWYQIIKFDMKIHIKWNWFDIKLIYQIKLIWWFDIWNHEIMKIWWFDMKITYENLIWKYQIWNGQFWWFDDEISWDLIWKLHMKITYENYIWKFDMKHEIRFIWKLHMKITYENHIWNQMSDSHGMRELRWNTNCMNSKLSREHYNHQT